jgi:hypothetical protein
MRTAARRGTAVHELAENYLNNEELKKQEVLPLAMFEDGKPKGGGAMQQTIPVNVNEAKRQGYKPVKNAKDVAIAEIDKPNNGRFK